MTFDTTEHGSAAAEMSARPRSEGGAKWPFTIPLGIEVEREARAPRRRPQTPPNRERSLSTLSRFDAMLIAKHLRHDRIRLEMETEPLTTDELEEFGPRATRVLQERVFQEIAEFLDQTARVGNATRLRKDLFDREKKAGTAMGGGLAMPHVRTMTVKDPTIAFLRSTPGLDFGAPDHLPVHVFLVLVAPPWDDRLYLKIYREAGTIFLREDSLPNLLGARNTNDVFNFFRACDLAAD